MEFKFAVVITSNDETVHAVIPTVHKPIEGREDDIMDEWIENNDPDYFPDTENGERGEFRYIVSVVKLTFRY